VVGFFVGIGVTSTTGSETYPALPSLRFRAEESMATISAAMTEVTKMRLMLIGMYMILLCAMIDDNQVT
jgi:hypothetical protein